MRQPKTKRRGASSSRRPFVEHRRDPTDRRSWLRTPVFAGDVAVPHYDPDRLVVVTGVLPRGRVEIVDVQRARRAVGAVRGLDDVQQALADRRVTAQSAPRRKLSPVTEGILAELKHHPRNAREEVTA